MTAPVRKLQKQDPESDEELIARVSRGELEALGKLFDRHERSIRAYVSRLGMPAGDSDDIAQGVFLEVVRSSARFDPQFSARSWLFGIATMLVRRQRRSVLRQAARLTRWSREKPSEEVRSPEDCYRGDVARARFEAAYRRLSAKKKEVFALVVLEGLSGDQAAHTLGIPVGTVWTRLHHARKELRGAVEESSP